MFAAVEPPAASLEPQQPYLLVCYEGVEGAHSVAAAANAGQYIVGQAALGLEDLRPRLSPDDALEVTDHHRVGVRADHTADKVVGGLHIGDPVAYRLVDGVFQCAGT